MLRRFGRKKENAENKRGEAPKEDVNSRFRDEEDKDPPKYSFRRPTPPPPSQEEMSLTEVLGELLQRLKTLDKQRTDLEGDVWQLGGEAEKEAEDLEKELSTLKEQTKELEGVLTAIYAHRKEVRFL
jgi:seryl-tRNA synthetase